MHHAISHGGSGRPALVLSHGTRQAQEYHTHEKRTAVPGLASAPGQDLGVVCVAGDVVRQTDGAVRVLLGRQRDVLGAVPVSQVVLLKAKGGGGARSPYRQA